MGKKGAGAANARKGGSEVETRDGQQVRKRRGVQPIWMGKLSAPDQIAAQQLLALGWETEDGSQWAKKPALVGLGFDAAKKQQFGDAEPAAVTGDEEDTKATAVDELTPDQMGFDLERGGFTQRNGAWISPKGRIFPAIHEAHQFLIASQTDGDDAPAGEREDGDATQEADRAAAAAKRKGKAQQSSQEEIKAEAEQITERAQAFKAWLQSPITKGLSAWAKHALTKNRRMCENPDLKSKDRDGAVIRLAVVKELMAEMHKPVIQARALKARAAELGDLFASTVDFGVDPDIDVDPADLPTPAGEPQSGADYGEEEDMEDEEGDEGDE